jgi:hypothetical protein
MPAKNVTGFARRGDGMRRIQGRAAEMDGLRHIRRTDRREHGQFAG